MENFLPNQSLLNSWEFIPETLNKALKEGRNSFQFRGEIVSVHQLPEFSAQDSSGNQKFFEKEAQIVEFFGVSR